jgi:hypothetical protein
MTETANRLGLSLPAVSIAARRGEEIARLQGYSLLNELLFIYLRAMFFYPFKK